MFFINDIFTKFIKDVLRINIKKEEVIKIISSFFLDWRSKCKVKPIVYR